MMSVKLIPLEDFSIALRSVVSVGKFFILGVNELMHNVPKVIEYRNLKNAYVIK